MTDTQLHVRAMQSFIVRNRNRKKVAKLAGVHEHTVSRFVHKHGAIALSTFIKIEKAIIKIKENPWFVDQKKEPPKGLLLRKQHLEEFHV